MADYDRTASVRKAAIKMIRIMEPRYDNDALVRTAAAAKSWLKKGCARWSAWHDVQLFGANGGKFPDDSKKKA